MHKRKRAKAPFLLIYFYVQKRVNVVYAQDYSPFLLMLRFFTPLHFTQNDNFPYKYQLRFYHHSSILQNQILLSNFLRSLFQILIIKNLRDIAFLVGKQSVMDRHQLLGV